MNKFEKYINNQNKSGFKIGDPVKVLRKAIDYEQGWNNTWSSNWMDKYVGKSGIITEIHDDGIILDISKEYRLPYFVLEKINNNKCCK